MSADTPGDQKGGREGRKDMKAGNTGGGGKDRGLQFDPTENSEFMYTHI